MPTKTVDAEQEVIESLTYPIADTYLRSWTAERAISEIVANSFDEDPEATFTWADGVLTIEDQGPGIPESGLILGISNKTDKQIGQFGEGIQVATIVMARNNKIGKVRIETVGYAFEPMMTKGSPVKIAARASGDGSGVPMLRYDFYRCSREQGTKITIECTEKIADAVRSRFLYFTDGYEAPSSPGRIIPGAKGRIYIGGVLVQDNPKLHFSYDLALSDAKALQNRDRTEISGWKLDRICAAIRATGDDEFLREWLTLYLSGELNDSESALEFSPRVRRTLLTLRDQIYPDTALAYATDDDSEAELELRDEGYTILKPRGRNDQYGFVKTMKAMDIHSTSELVRKPAERKQRTTDWIAEAKLDATELRNLNEGIRIVRGLWGPDAIKTYGVYETTSLEGVGENTALGFYQPHGGKIGIQRAVLADFEQTVSVLTHEAAHRLRHRGGSGAYDYGDRTRGFEEQLEKMAASAALRLHALDQIPDPERAAAEAAEAQASNPSAMARELIRERMKSEGIDSAKALANRSGVTVGKVRNLLNGKMAPQPDDTQALCSVLGLEWAPLFAALIAERLTIPDRQMSDSPFNDGGIVRLVGGSYSLTRRKNGRIYGARHTDLLVAAAALRATGNGVAKYGDVVEGHAFAYPNLRLDWLEPYRQLVDHERTRLAV